jgi:hypothetical protein
MNKAHREKNRAHGCIFVSYASPDLEIARYVVSQLHKAGCLAKMAHWFKTNRYTSVWFHKEQLQGGENWEEELRNAVEERCGLFQRGRDRLMITLKFWYRSSNGLSFGVGST